MILFSFCRARERRMPMGLRCCYYVNWEGYVDCTAWVDGKVKQILLYGIFYKMQAIQFNRNNSANITCTRLALREVKLAVNPTAL